MFRVEGFEGLQNAPVSEFPKSGGPLLYLKMSRILPLKGTPKAGWPNLGKLRASVVHKSETGC